MINKNAEKTYRNRFDDLLNHQRGGAWRILCNKVFQHYVDPEDTVLDVGAGYCEFINNIKCKRKIAVDFNPDTKKYAANDVEVIQGKIGSLSNKLNGQIDVVFMSNFLEHLDSKEEVLSTIEKAGKLLKKEGILIIMQPNIDLVKENYWSFIDHKVPLNGASVIEALSISGFEIKKFTKHFLPYTSKSKLPLIPLLIKAYLSIPQILRPFAGQSLFVSIKRD